MDGASTSFILNEKNKFLVGSHNVIKSSSNKSDGGFYKDNIWLESAEKYSISNVLNSLKKEYKLKTIAIQGETYGDKVQKRNYSLKTIITILPCFTSGLMVIVFRSNKWLKFAASIIYHV